MKIQSANKNYLARVVQINELQPHPNADRLQIAIVDFQKVITGLNTKVGDVMIYFPLECKINSDFLSYCNAFRKSCLNENKEVKGMFDENRRVRAQKLRGIPSEGYLHPIGQVNEWLAARGINDEISNGDIGKDFDTLGETLFVEKYVPYTKMSGTPKKKDKKAKRESRLVDGQFRTHEDTENLKRNIQNISPDDIISVSFKMHGCVDKDTIVQTDIGDLKIGDIVKNKINCKILTHDVTSGKDVYSKIDDFYFLEDSGEWYELETEDGKTIKITGNNPVWMPLLCCYRRVDDLVVGDTLQVSF